MLFAVVGGYCGSVVCLAVRKLRSMQRVRVHYGEIDLLNMHGGTTEDACEAFDMIVSGAINVAPLLNGECPLEQVELALKKMIAGEVVKMVINPDL